jgi:hypothetical protein
MSTVVDIYHKRAYSLSDPSPLAALAAPRPAFRPGICLLHRDSAAYRIDDGRARPTREAARTRSGGSGANNQHEQTILATQCSFRLEALRSRLQVQLDLERRDVAV